jgi:hypothetical protein
MTSHKHLPVSYDLLFQFLYDLTPQLIIFISYERSLNLVFKFLGGSFFFFFFTLDESSFHTYQIQGELEREIPPEKKTTTV